MRLVISKSPVPHLKINRYRVFQGFRLNLGKGSNLIIFESFLTSFEASRSSRTKIDTIVKSNHQIKSSLSKSLIRTLVLVVCLVYSTVFLSMTISITAVLQPGRIRPTCLTPGT